MNNWLHPLMLGASVFLPCLCSRPARSSTIPGRGAGKVVGSDGACMNGISPLGKRKTNTSRHATSVVAKNIVPPPSHNRGSCSNQFYARNPLHFSMARCSCRSDSNNSAASWSLQFVRDATNWFACSRVSFLTLGGE
jgi:hypothetical protein